MSAPFEHQNTIYRDFDIRGRYPEEITDDEVYKIAKALVLHFGVKRVAIGYDIRPSAEALRESLTRGFVESGVAVVNLGSCTTPMSYYMCGQTDIDMAVMITASHMPSHYNGLKITVDDAKPVSRDILQIIKNIVGTHTFSEEVTHGSVTNHALQADWIAAFKKNHDLTASGLSIVIDPANMIGILEIATFKAFEPDITVHSIFDSFDHTCPNHEANPIKFETLVPLGCEVVAKKADIGIAFDGDADRVGFVDETGTPVPSDIIGVLLSRKMLKKYPGATIICDVRATKSVVDEVTKLGGTIYREKVGHTNIRSRMRTEDAVFGLELSGHFFFKETNFSEGGALPAFLILELLKEEKKTLSQLVKEVTLYHHTGEINSTITQSISDIYAHLEAQFATKHIDHLDGVTITSTNWWCNVRPSANDPVMRLNLEATSEVVMEEKRDEILAIIRAA